MTGLIDVLIGRPLPDVLGKTVLFLAFALHFVFVLFTLGTAMLALAFLARSRTRPYAAAWDRELMSSFFVHKSAAIVLGVGAILTMMLVNTVPFFTAVRLFPAQWMLLAPLLLVSLGLLEYVTERKGDGSRRHVAAAALGVLVLLGVPATFSLVMATAENPAVWERGLTAGSPPWLLGHWIARLGHVLGASIVFSGALFLFFFPADDRKRAALYNWIIAGVAFQVADGVMLFASLPRRVPGVALFFLATGVGALGLLLWTVSRRRLRPAGPAVVTVLLTVLLMSMLLTRQLLQDVVFVPLNAAAQANAERYQAAAFTGAAPEMATYDTRRHVDFGGPFVIFYETCNFCHGPVGHGDGEDARLLGVPPEDLSAVRTSRRHLRRILLDGVPGSGMPPFTYYTEGELQGLLNLLYARVGASERVEPVKASLTDADRQEAASVFSTTCANCHGQDGRGTELSRGFRPRPPDLTALSFSPTRTFQVVSTGYPGTMMRSFAPLPERTRWGLAEVVGRMYGDQSP